MHCALIPPSLRASSLNVVRGVVIDHAQHRGELRIVKIGRIRIRNTKRVAHDVRIVCFWQCTKKGNRERRITGIRK